MFVQCFLRQTSSTWSYGKRNWRKVFLYFSWEQVFHLAGYHDRASAELRMTFLCVCVCVVLYEHVHVQVRVCADVRAQVWEWGGLKMTSLYCCLPCCLRQCLPLSLNQELNIHLDYLASQPALGNLLPPLSPCWDYRHVPWRLYFLGIKFRSASCVVSAWPWTPLPSLNISLSHNNQVIWIILADILWVAAQTPMHTLNPTYTDLLHRVRDGC